MAQARKRCSQAKYKYKDEGKRLTFIRMSQSFGLISSESASDRFVQVLDVAETSAPTDDAEDKITTIEVVLIDRIHRTHVLCSAQLHVRSEDEENSDLIIANSKLSCYHSITTLKDSHIHILEDAGLKVEVGLGLRKTVRCFQIIFTLSIIIIIIRRYQRLPMYACVKPGPTFNQRRK